MIEDAEEPRLGVATWRVFQAERLESNTEVLKKALRELKRRAEKPAFGQRTADRTSKRLIMEGRQYHYSNTYPECEFFMPSRPNRE